MKIPDGSVGEIAPADWLSAVSPLEYPVLMRSNAKLPLQNQAKNRIFETLRNRVSGRSDYADHPRLDYADP
ncbi:hypothetical protein [Mycetohabitans endofungorum]|uniref:hypothetical protein n=1 Tax=Mycetohabitans endofungorum TaxID=417203 RepID=UPI002B0608C8|nr:hypothetical protein [Mycetohabitans endofungorum]